MKKIILSLIIAVAALTVSADGITIKQLRVAGKKAAIEASAAIKRGERIETFRFHNPRYKQLRVAVQKASIGNSVKKCNMEEKIEEFVKKLRANRQELAAKRRYMNEHNFSKEAEYIATKIKVIDEILTNLTPISEGKNMRIIFEF